MDANDKSFWVDNAPDEAEFVDLFGKTLGVIRNPSKDDDRYAPDLYSYRHGTLADIKAQREPFRTSNTYGVDSNLCVTLNVMDLVRYGVLYGGRFIVYFWLNHPNNPSNGVYGASCKVLVENIAIFRRKIHQYQTRDGSDGNKTHSFVLDVTDFKKFI